MGNRIDGFDATEAALRHLADAVKAAAAKADKAAKETTVVRKELGDKIDALGEKVSKLASARLLQQAFTSLVLAGALTALIQVVHG